MYAEALRAIFQHVSATMLDAELGPATQRPDAEPALSAFVSFRGRFSGRLTLSVSQPLARALTAHLLQKPGWDSSAEDVADALGELANIVAGNLRGLLPAPTQLSLPQVRRGLPLPDGDALASLARVELCLFDEPVCIELCGCAVWHGPGAREDA